MGAINRVKDLNVKLVISQLTTRVSIERWDLRKSGANPWPKKQEPYIRLAVAKFARQSEVLGY